MNQNKSKRNPIPTFEETAVFHGHACPGLALGYRVAVAAMARLSAVRAVDEDFVAIVENDACSVDAVQCVCGCTFGKGNLVFRDHGKHVYTFFNRANGKGIRIYAEPPEKTEPEMASLARKTDRSAEEQAKLDNDRKHRTDWLLSLPEQDLLRITETREPPPSKARIHASSRCALCGERMMETRCRVSRSQTLCAPCAEALTDDSPEEA